MIAKALTPEEIADIMDLDENLLLKIEGETYSLEDAYICWGCSVPFIDASKLDSYTQLCSDCEEEAAGERETLRQWRSDYYASVL